MGSAKNYAVAVGIAFIEKEEVLRAPMLVAGRMVFVFEIRNIVKDKKYENHVVKKNLPCSVG